MYIDLIKVGKVEYVVYDLTSSDPVKTFRCYHQLDINRVIKLNGVVIKIIDSEKVENGMLYTFDY